MARMEWFKLFTEARLDKKLATLTDTEHRIWFDLLCFAADQKTRGTIKYEEIDLVALEVSRADEEALLSALAKLAKLKIITHMNNTITFIHFAQRQARKASDEPEAAAERKRRQRSKKVQQAVVNEREQLANFDETGSNDGDTSRDVTRDNDDVTRCHALDKDRDKDSERESDPSVVGVDSQSKARERRASKRDALPPLPRKSLEVTEEQVNAYRNVVPPPAIVVAAYARLRNWPTGESRAFFDHHQTAGWLAKGHNRLLKDWQAAMRTWESKPWFGTSRRAPETEDGEAPTTTTVEKPRQPTTEAGMRAAGMIRPFVLKPPPPLDADGVRE